VAGVRNFDETVASLVPVEFDAYARIFHPALRHTHTGDVEVRWSEVAAANGRTMHPSAEWGSLTGSWRLNEQRGLWDSPPRSGELPEALAVRLAVVLASYTNRPECSYFAVWDGWDTSRLVFSFDGDTPENVQGRKREAAEEEAVAWCDLVQSGPAFTLPNRGMRLLRGPLKALDEFYRFHHRPPSLWWPEDRAWCVGTDVDLMTSYLGASDACINAVLADEKIEALPVSPDQRVTWDSDRVNPLPAPP
jgi:hypothetical protein